MRFARSCSIFRGPLDPAPIIGVLFLLVIFMMLGNLLYTPGVLVHFDEKLDAPVITVTKNNDVVFNGKTNKVEDLARLREEDLKKVVGEGPFQLKVDSGADAKVVNRVQEMFQIQLPDGDPADLTGTDNPTVIVAVNFRGQCFFENRPVHDYELQAELHRQVQEAGKEAKTLTVVLAVDKAASNDVTMRLLRLGRAAGVKSFLLAERLNEVGGTSRHPRS